ncbi:MAG: SMP-30/gluconolactonase/LRE family protein [Rhizobiaceae bacterium]|nr:SMP-30/gluconolactonase/LRE family protein [Rhizobiaceae bacterium]
MKTYDARTLANGFAYPEGPRWREGLLWFADQHARTVHALDAGGKQVEQFAVGGSPSGIGWLPGGDMLVVSMETHEVLRRTREGLERHADLSAYHKAQSNEMVVLPDGGAYVGNIGFDFDNGEDPAPTLLLLVEPDGTVRQVADDLLCPNGTVVSPDRRTLVIAESLAHRLTAFDVTSDGSLSNRRVFADIPGHVPDGICLDAEGQVWAASPFTNSVIRVREGGEITATVPVADAGAFACMLGGPDRRTLFICCAAEHHRSKTVALRSGRIDVARVDVPGAGWP